MVRLRGGLRPNSGRKPSHNRRLAKQVYVSPDLDERIAAIEIPGCHSFSSKCTYLMENGLDYLNYKTDQLKKNNTVRYIDLFAGLGGIRLGFEQALKDKGLHGESVFVSEIKPAAKLSYEENFSDKIAGDITKIDAKDIPNFDYVLAGFPCQAFSNAGNRLGFEDTRGTLFFDVARIIKEKRPKGFLLENVEGLVHHDGGKTFKVIYNTLIDLGYSVSFRVLAGSDFGLAQNRKRIYIVGTRDSDQHVELDHFQTNISAVLGDVIDSTVPARNTDFTKKLLSHYSLQEVSGKSIKDKRGGSNNIHSWDFELKGKVTADEKKLLESLLLQRRNKKWASKIGIDWMDGMPLTEAMISTFYPNKNLNKMLNDLTDKGYLVYEYPKKKVGNRRVYDETLEKGFNIVTGKLSFEYSKILSPNEVTPTLVATDLSHLGVPVKNGIRPLTVPEILRLFGFPEDYHLPEEKIGINKAYDLLGNTVCVPVIKAVAEKLLDVTEKENISR